MPYPHPHDRVAALKVVISTSISLAFMMVDFLYLIRDECKHVWPRVRCSWTAKIYVLTRYLGLFSQIFNVGFTVRMYLGVQTSPAGCRIWFAFQAAVVQFLLIFVEGLLMFRLHALFLHDRLILVTLISFAVGQVASMGISAGLTFPSNRHTVTCLLLRSNPGNAYFSMTTATTTLVLFFMTFWRYFCLPTRWTEHVPGRIVLRDSALSLSAITVMMIFLTLCALRVIQPSLGGNIVYYWLVCILWVSLGRIIIDQEKLSLVDRTEESGSSIWDGTLQLTSQIEMGQSTSSVDTTPHIRPPILVKMPRRWSPMPSSKKSEPSLSNATTNSGMQKQPRLRSSLSPSSVGAPGKEDPARTGEEHRSDPSPGPRPLDPSRPNVCDPKRTESPRQAEGDTDEPRHHRSPSPSPQPCSEQPTSEASS